MGFIKGLLSVVLWAIPLPVKLLLLLLGLVAVAIDRRAKWAPWVNDPDRPNTYWERAIRNPVGGFDYLIPHPDHYESFHTKGVPDPEPVHHDRRFVWRFNRSGMLSSLRLVWRYSDDKYGELYFGWKLGSAPPKLDFGSSIRPWATVGE